MIHPKQDQPRGPRPASQMAYRPPNPDRQNDNKQLSVRDVGDRSLLGLGLAFIET